MIGQLAAVIAVLASLAGCTWWLRKRGWVAPALPARARNRRLVTVERLALGPQHSLHLVRLGDHALLVAASPSGCTLLERRVWRDIEERTGVGI